MYSRVSKGEVNGPLQTDRQQGFSLNLNTDRLALMRKVALLLLTGSWMFAAGGPARAWVDTVILATWLEGPANPNPPFDQFGGDGPFFYPYTWRTTFTQNKVNHGWRALLLENDYLKCTILVDLGGHLMCQDKVNNKDMFYANPSIRKQQIALRGAWVATGVEVNFPVGHSLVTVSPVDFAARQNADGSASAWISSVDRVSGMEFAIEFVLQPGSALLTENVTLSNPGSVRHRYYWWNNAEVQVEDAATTVIMPTNVVFNAGTGLDTWPTSSAGIDFSTYGGQKNQNSLFAVGSQEPFFGVFHAHSRTGVAHYADPNAVTGKKTYTWGTADTYSRANLSGNNSTYIEVQAGLTANQETFLFLNPQEVRHFTEYWLPIRGIDGVSRVTPDGVLSYRRGPAANGAVSVTAEFLPTHAAAGATIRLMDGATVVQQTKANLAPEVASTATFAGIPAASTYRLEVVNAQGKILVAHSEGGWNATKASDVKLGPQPAPNYSNPFTEADFLATAGYWESSGNLNKAAATYQQGLAAYPQSAALLAAGGRASVEMNNFQEGITRLTSVLAIKSDPESRYYLGVAYEGLGDDVSARAAFAGIADAAAQDSSPFVHAAKFRMVLIQARAGDYAGALALLQPALGTSADQVREGAVEVSLLRKLGRASDAESRLAFWLGVAPADLVLRFERYRVAGERTPAERAQAATPAAASARPLLPSDDPEYFRQLAADPERVLDVATHLFDLGLFDDALLILERRYGEIVDPIDAEPGRVAPQNYPLVSYYRAYAQEKTGQASAAAEYRAASAQSIQYVFPNRLDSAKVLTAAIARNANDATAHALLGSLWFSFRQTDDAISEWQKARTLNKNLPMLQRNLGRALLEVKNDPKDAIPILQEGLMTDPTNPEIPAALAKAQSLLTTQKSQPAQNSGSRRR
jgi:tetratricopeptide (TPR) repeat protein